MQGIRLDGLPRRKPRRRDIRSRFWDKVDRRGDDECWPWLAGHTCCGYGAFRVEGVTTLASRAAWHLFVGPIPEGMCVLHHCDNRWCTNYITHLFLGTQEENIADMVSKGRNWVHEGEAHVRAKLTAAQVQRFRERCQQEPKAEVIQDYMSKWDVSKSMLEHIYYERTWRQCLKAA
jgi:hypothetical protein